MLGIRCGYYTDDSNVAYKIDSIVEFMEPFIKKCTGFLFKKLNGMGEVDESKLDEYVGGTWGTFIPVIEARLLEHSKPFIAGTERPTIADFAAFQIAFGATDINPHSVMPESIKSAVMARIASSAAYQAWFNRMKQELASYMAVRPAYPA